MSLHYAIKNQLPGAHRFAIPKPIVPKAKLNEPPSAQVPSITNSANLKAVRECPKAFRRAE